MRTVTKAALAAVGAVGLASAYRTYADRSVERVDYEVVGRLDGVELRRYPDAVVAETVAPDDATAFRRLFRYIDGANGGEAGVARTAPVASEPAGTDGSPAVGEGAEIPMTAPVATETAESGVRMSFFLPAGYTAESAPTPTDDSVTVRTVPGRTLAVRPFSWWATDGRVERRTRDLLATLVEHGVRASGEPFLMRYEGPGVAPFLRRNEVAVEVSPRR